MSAAILCPTVCICEFIDKAGTYGRSVKYTTSQPSSAHHWSRVKEHGCTLICLNSRQENAYFGQILIGQPDEACK